MATKFGLGAEISRLPACLFILSTTTQKNDCKMDDSLSYLLPHSSFFVRFIRHVYKANCNVPLLLLEELLMHFPRRGTGNSKT